MVHYFGSVVKRLQLKTAVKNVFPALATKNSAPIIRDGIIMRCDSDSGKKLIKSMVLRTADRQGMC